MKERPLLLLYHFVIVRSMYRKPNLLYTSPMTKRTLHRNIRASDNLETFLVAAASSLLTVRFSLYLTNYPSLGGDRLHIAHMLYGGLLMMAALILTLSFIGPRVQRWVAIIGGLGFGIFIDELGKFITRDNNYFFQPTIGIIYAIFTSLYLLARYVGRNRSLSSKEYQLNALAQLEEAVIDDMDPTEKQRVLDLLRLARPSSPITKHLLALVNEVDTVPAERASLTAAFRRVVEDRYRRLNEKQRSKKVIQWFFVAESLTFVVGITLVMLTTVSGAFSATSGVPRYDFVLAIAEFASSGISALIVIAGIVRLRQSRAKAYELFRAAVVVNLLLTEFFMFSRVQFQAMPSFAFNVALYVVIRFALRQESGRGRDTPRPA